MPHPYRYMIVVQSSGAPQITDFSAVPDLGGALAPVLREHAAVDLSKAINAFPEEVWETISHDVTVVGSHVLSTFLLRRLAE